jgi:hypothetical protein
MTRRTALIALLVAGVVFTAAYLSLSYSGASSDEVQIVTAPAVRLPLDGLRTSRQASVLFTVPATRMWQRFEREWGEPPYIVFVTSGGNQRKIEPLSDLGLDIRITGRGQPLTTTPGKSQPYAYSVVGNPPFPTLTFIARPGTDVRVDITAADPALLPDGELRIEPLWLKGGLKDVYVQAIVAGDTKLKLGLSFLLAVIAGALVIGSRRGRRRSTQENA